MKRLRGFARHEGGATAAEFAMVITPLLLMIFGITEYSRYLWTANALEQTAFRTARCMGVLQSNCSAGGAANSSAAVTYAQSLSTAFGITLPAANVAATVSTTCGGASGFSQVRITYTFQTVVPALIANMASGLTLNESACFPNQGG